ncbi:MULTISPECIES: hypothetical protein [unclassified Microcoleus]|uniref:hypothetical protein n=1 Tax=unclassified Microcoleus TaxID=2642155 RepID=UPI002FCF6123
MIPHPLWQAYTQKGSSVDRPEAARLAAVWQGALFHGFVSDSGRGNKSEANKISAAVSLVVEKC